MTLKEIETTILDSVNKITSFAKQNCTNSFSDNVKFIENFIIEKKQKDDDRTQKRKLLHKRKFIDIHKLATNIYKKQNNLIWIDIVLSYSSANETIMIVDLIEKKNSDSLNFHACYRVPSNYIQKKKKFDLNWWFDDGNVSN